MPISKLIVVAVVVAIAVCIKVTNPHVKRAIARVNPDGEAFEPNYGEWFSEYREYQKWSIQYTEYRREYH